MGDCADCRPCRSKAPAKGDLGRKRSQLPVQFIKFLSGEMLQGFLEERIFGVEVEIVEKGKELLKRIRIVTIGKTHVVSPFKIKIISPINISPVDWGIFLH
jgi:hypothetical protein